MTDCINYALKMINFMKKATEPHQYLLYLMREIKTSFTNGG